MSEPIVFNGIVLADTCEYCKGEGYMENVGECPYCSGVGTQETEHGQALRVFIQRHVRVESLFKPR